MTARIEQSMRVVLCAFACLLLASCGGATPADPPRTVSSTKQEVSVAPLSVPPPPGADARALSPGQIGTEYMPNGLPALQPSRGLNPEMMFAEKLKDQDARFTRLENAVMDMRKEFESVKPAIIRLAAVEEDMQILLKQLESLVQNPPPAIEEVPAAEEQVAIEQSAEPIALTPPVPAATKPPPAPVASPPPSAVAGGANVQNIRVGERESATRLVIDLSRATNFRHDLDNGEHLLLVELPDAGWSVAQSAALDKSPLLESWSVQKMENGTGSRLIIRLRKNVVVVTASALTSPDRIMIDLRAE